MSVYAKVDLRTQSVHLKMVSPEIIAIWIVWEGWLLRWSKLAKKTKRSARQKLFLRKTEQTNPPMGYCLDWLLLEYSLPVKPGRQVLTPTEKETTRQRSHC